MSYPTIGKLVFFRNAALAATLATAVLTLLAASPARGSFSIDAFSASPDVAPAASHPDSTVSMTFGGDEAVKDIIQHFPAGIIPNPEALPKCSATQLAADACPPASRLGPISITVVPKLIPIPVTASGDVYNLAVDPPYIGGLGFVVRQLLGLQHNSLAAPFTVRSGWRDFTSSLPNEKPDIKQQPLMPTQRDYGLSGISVDVPNEILGIQLRVTHIEYTLPGMVGDNPARPYISTTTACGTGYAELEATSWENPDTKVNSLSNVLTGTDCGDPPLFDQIPFDPTLGAELETKRTDTPSGYTLTVNLPDDEGERHESHLKRAQLTLPEGTALSPPAGEGLETCSDQQIGIGFNDPPTCPAGSNVGDVTVESLNFPEALHGNIYLGDSPYPFDGQSFLSGQPTPAATFRLFIAFPIVDGTWIKLDGTTTPDQHTGRLTTAFDDVPPLPFTSMTLSLKGGDRALLVNPSTCGDHTIETTLTPWKSATDFPPEADEHPGASFTTSYDGQGAGCPNPLPFDPAGSAATDPTQAGASSTLAMAISNPDRNQLLKTFRASLPPGLVGRLRGLPLCSAGDATAGRCPQDSLVGTASASVGSGSSPLSLPGSIFATEPLQAGDPAGMAIMVPAMVGPFSFGSVVTRARVILRSDGGLDILPIDDLPQIVAGVPIRLRDVSTSVNRPNFILNPTICEHQQFASSFTSVGGAQKDSSAPYQATGCDLVPYDPQLSISMNPSAPDQAPAISATVTQQEGEGTTKRVQTTFPRAFKINPKTTATHCPEENLAAKTCPEGSRVGEAEADSTLLPEGQTLKGGVYLAGLTQSEVKISALLTGLVDLRIDARARLNSDISTTVDFDGLPPLPLSRFDLRFLGGDKGLLRTPKVCGPQTMTASFESHTAKVKPISQVLKISGCRKPKLDATLTPSEAGKPADLELDLQAKGNRIRSVRFGIPRELGWGIRGRARGAKNKKGSRAGSVVFETGDGPISAPLAASRKGRGIRFAPVGGKRRTAAARFSASLSRSRRKPHIALGGLPKNDLTGIDLSLRGRNPQRAFFLKNPRGCKRRLSFTARVTTAEGKRLTVRDRVRLKGKRCRRKIS